MGRIYPFLALGLTIALSAGARSLPPLTATRKAPDAPHAPAVKPPTGRVDCPLVYTALTADPKDRAAKVAGASLRSKALGAALAGHAGALGAAGIAAKRESEKAEQAKSAAEEKKAEERREKQPFAKLAEKAPEKKSLTLPTREQLLARAAEALSVWKKTGSLPADFDFGRFVLESEFVDDPARNDESAADAFALKDDLKKQIGAAGSWNKAVAALKPYVKQYCADYAMLSDFFRLGCGNCEANTKLLAASFHDVGVKVPAGKELGLQLFSDHIQPVLIDRGTRAVTSIYAGTRYEPTPTPVYRPEMLLQAYLSKNGGPEIASQADLMMVDSAEAKGGNQNDPTNTNLAMGYKMGAAFSEGRVPKFARQGRVGEGSGRGRGRGGRGSESGEYGDGGGRTLDELYATTKVRAPAAEERLQYANPLAAAGFAYDPLNRVLLTDDPALRAAWRAAGDGDKASELLIGRLQLALPKLFRSGGLAELRTILEDPSRLAELTPEKADAILSSLNQLNALRAGFHNEFTEDAPSVSDSPGYRMLAKAMNALTRKVDEHPETWLAELDRLPPERLTSALRVINYPYYTASLSEPMDPIYKLVTKEKKVDTFRPLVSGNLDQFDTMIDIDFSGGSPRGTFYRGGQPDDASKLNGKPAPGKGDIPRARPDAAIEIKPQTMAGILLSRSNAVYGMNDGADCPSCTGSTLTQTNVGTAYTFPGLDAVKELWSSSLTKQKRENLKTPEYDLNFVRLMHDPKFLSSLTEPAARERYRDLRFVKLTYRGEQRTFQPLPELAHLYGSPLYLYPGDPSFPRIAPAELAEAYRESLARLFPGEPLEITEEPITLPAALDALKQTPPKPFYPNGSYNNSGFGIMPGKAMSVPGK